MANFKQRTTDASKALEKLKAQSQKLSAKTAAQTNTAPQTAAPAASAGASASVLDELIEQAVAKNVPQTSNRYTQEANGGGLSSITPELLAGTKNYSDWVRDEGFVEAAQEQKWQDKYAGMDYAGIRRAMESASDPGELKWLQAHAPNAMSTADYDAQIADWEKKLDYWQQNNRVDGYATAHDEQGNQH